jgi:hypothetical protein
MAAGGAALAGAELAGAALGRTSLAGVARPGCALIAPASATPKARNHGHVAAFGLTIIRKV